MHGQISIEPKFLEIFSKNALPDFKKDRAIDWQLLALALLPWDDVAILRACLHEPGLICSPS